MSNPLMLEMDRRVSVFNSRPQADQNDRSLSLRPQADQRARELYLWPQKDQDAQSLYALWNRVHEFPRRSPSIKVKSPEAQFLAEDVQDVQPLAVSLYLSDERIQFSGTLVDSSGIVATCASLLGDWRTPEVMRKTKVRVDYDSSGVGHERFEGRIVYVDFLHDIAIIKIIHSGYSFPHVSLGSAKLCCQDDVLLAAGRYKESFLDCIPQYLAREARVDEVYKALFGEIVELVSVCATPRMYGGPLLNSHKEVIGIMTASGSTAISAKAVAEVLCHYKKEWDPSSSRKWKCRLRMLKISAAQKDILYDTVAAEVNGVVAKNLCTLMSTSSKSESLEVSLIKVNGEAAHCKGVRYLCKDNRKGWKQEYLECLKKVKGRRAPPGLSVDRQVIRF